MAIAVICSQCQKNFRVADNFAGKQGRCPQCNFVLVVPSPEAGRRPNPFGDAEATVIPPPPPPRREPRDEPPPRRENRDEPPPRRRSERVEDDDDRPSRRTRASERDRDDDDERDLPEREAPRRSWNDVRLGVPLLIGDGIANLVGRGCYLLGLILIFMTEDSGRYSVMSFIIALSLIAFTATFIASVLGLVGKLTTRFAPDANARTQGGVSCILSLISFGFLVLTELVIAFTMGPSDPQPRRGGRPPTTDPTMMLILMMIGLYLTYVSDIFLMRFIGRVGQLVRNRTLAGWGTILTIFYGVLMGYSLILIILFFTATNPQLVMTLGIIFLALDFAGILLGFLPRPRLSKVLRQLHEHGPAKSSARFDEEDDEDPPPRRNRRPRDDDEDS